MEHFERMQATKKLLHSVEVVAHFFTTFFNNSQWDHFDVLKNLVPGPRYKGASYSDNGKQTT